MATFRPLGDRMLVRVDKEQGEKVLASGIVLAAMAVEKPYTGEVVAVGPGSFADGDLRPVPVSEGDKVVFSRYGGSEIQVDEEKFLILRESDVLGVLEPDVQGVE